MNILLLTQEDCHFCEEAKALLIRLASEYRFSLETLNISSTEGQRLALNSGILFPPGVIIDGAPFSYGRLSERKFRKELERRLKSKDSI